MIKTLIAGCSFLATLPCEDDVTWNLDHDRYQIAATAGSGNQALSSRIMFECATQSFKEVIVIWTGINRLDVTIPSSVHETMPKTGENEYNYSFNTKLKNRQWYNLAWYHSGGRIGSWIWDDSCPVFLKNWFKIQYLCGNSSYLNDLSLISIINTQCFLESQKIPYRMAFSYDITKPDGYRHDHAFGKIDERSPYYPLIKWNRIIIDQPLFEWGQSDSTRLDPDQFHPTREAVREWFKLVFDLELAK